MSCICGTGSVCGQAIADHKDIRKLGFTGSTEIGQVIMKSCAVSNLKKVSLELGGKSPFIIFADCDLDKAVRMVRQPMKLLNMVSRIYVLVIYEVFYLMKIVRTTFSFNNELGNQFSMIVKK